MRPGSRIGQTGVVVGFFSNFSRLHAAVSPRASTGLDLIPLYFGHDLDIVSRSRPSGREPAIALQMAAQLLRDTDQGIAEIAGRVGYESEATFNRAFKRYAGEPPATWRSGARARGHLSR